MNRIKEVLEAKGISQTELANRLGKTFNMVNLYATNKVQPPIPVLYQIADILNVDVRDLLIPNKITEANSNLKEAKAAKNDEFYTQFHDIEIEMNAYLEYDPNVFRGKTILLPCDDPEWSNFTRFFAAKFDELGLKKLISTSYAPDSKKYKTPYQPSLFEQEAPQFDSAKPRLPSKGRYSYWNKTKAVTGVSI